MSSSQSSPYPAGVGVVTPQEIASLADEVAAFERKFDLPSSEMFDGDPPVISTLEETDELHEWARVWIRLNALRQS